MKGIKETLKMLQIQEGSNLIIECDPCTYGYGYLNILY